MKNKLTDRQLEILEFIQGFIETNSFPPTYREIGEHFNIASTFGVKRHIDALIKKGFLISGNNTSRTLSLVDSSNSITNNDSSLIEIPVVGRVAAGTPLLAEENIEGKISLDQDFIGGKQNCFGLKVNGDSMINAGIIEGDTVIVYPNSNIFNGDIVIAMIDAEATMKRFEKHGDKVLLIPENDAYQTIVVQNNKNFNLVGKVIGVFRWYN